MIPNYGIGYHVILNLLTSPSSPTQVERQANCPVKFSPLPLAVQPAQYGESWSKDRVLLPKVLQVGYMHMYNKCATVASMAPWGGPCSPRPSSIATTTATRRDARTMPTSLSCSACGHKDGIVFSRIPRPPKQTKGPGAKPQPSSHQAWPAEELYIPYERTREGVGFLKLGKGCYE